MPITLFSSNDSPFISQIRPNLDITFHLTLEVKVSLYDIIESLAYIYNFFAAFKSDFERDTHFGRTPQGDFVCLLFKNTEVNCPRSWFAMVKHDQPLSMSIVQDHG